jgi:molybdopterin-biosynthesis enzyme MoeA-like protein
METFDDITCEEYSSAFGTDEQAFAEWMNAVEELMIEGTNADLRELAEMEIE